MRGENDNRPRFDVPGDFLADGLKFCICWMVTLIHDVWLGRISNILPR